MPLTASYGVRDRGGLAFSIVLQATEAIVGVAVGFMFLLVEGVGFGQLRRRPRRRTARLDRTAAPPRWTRSPARSPRPTPAVHRTVTA